MINNKIVKRKFVTNLVYLVAGLICAGLVYPISTRSTKVEQQSKEESISFAQAYANDMVSHEYRRDNSYLAYLDIDEEPYGFAYYDDGDEFAYVFDDEGMYLIQGSKTEMQTINDSIKNDGTAHLIGTVEELDEEVLQFAYETYEEWGIENPMTREEFDEYFQGVGLDIGSRASATIDLELLAVFVGFMAFLLLLAGVPSVISFISANKKLSDEDREMLEAELEDPRTVYMKNIGVFLTPRFLINVNRRLVVLPFEDIIWSYRYTYRYWFVPIIDNVKIFTRNKTKKSIANMNVFTSYPDRIVQQLFTEISQRNPVAFFGYTKEAQNYYYSGAWNKEEQSA